MAQLFHTDLLSFLPEALKEDGDLAAIAELSGVGVPLSETELRSETEM